MAPKRKRTPSSGATYQVFLSFRGPDTRLGFADVLYHALTDAGIRVFRDNEEIRTGEDIGDEIRRAISDSRIFVPIFSKGYASSKWCLMELSMMFESKEASPKSKKKILPIFYDVSADDVKLKTELYVKALSKHQKKKKKKISPETIKQWKEALCKAGKIKGHVVDRGHGEFVKKFVEEVSRKLKAKHKLVTDNLVQRDEQVEALMGLLDMEASDVRFVGIHGMGGIGKTTLVKNVYNNICDRFERCSFLTDVRELCQRKGIEHLQEKLLGDLGIPSRDIKHVEDGIMTMREMLPHKKILIVLDDVDDQNQIKSLALAADDRRFCQGSRIIITTRNQQVLGPRIQKMEVEPMKPDEALWLFSMHAFDNDSPPIEHLSLSKDAVESTGRLPLALEVIGSYLRDIPHKKWAKKIERLQKVPQEEVQKKLMISYESLSKEAQQIFLDIACFFIGCEKTDLMYMWEACKFDAKMELKELIHKSLVKIDKLATSDGLGKAKRFRMHDQLRDLGRDIAKHSRIWMREDALNLLGEEEDSVDVQMVNLGYDIYYPRPKDTDNLSWEEFSGLKELRYLYCYGTIFSCNKRRLLPKLRCLYWRSCPVEFTGTCLSLKKLVILRLNWSDITEDWTGWSKIGEANNLKVLDLTGCEKLRRMPDLSKYSRLERLILEYCEGLVEIDCSIGRLKCLKFLNVKACRSLKGLPDELYSLNRLEVILGLPDPSFGPPDRAKIFNFPESISNLTSLGALRFRLFGTTKLPESIIRLSGLHNLALSGIVELPQRVGLLENLKILELTYCPDMKKLPDSIGDMKSLVELDLSRSGITELPETIGNLEKLRVISLTGSGIHKLPNSIGKLKGLEVLAAGSCESLTHIPSTIKGCTSLSILDLALFERLKKLPDSIVCARWREWVTFSNLNREWPLFRRYRWRLLDWSSLMYRNY